MQRYLLQERFVKTDKILNYIGNTSLPIIDADDQPSYTQHISSATRLLNLTVMKQFNQKVDN